MTQILEVPTKDGQSVLVEIRETGVRERRAGAARLVAKSTATLESLLARVRSLADAAVSAIGDARPDEMGIELGVNLTMEGNVVFASSSVEANFRVSLKWKGPAQPTNVD